MTKLEPALLAEVLNRLEDKEAALLTWGLVDGGFAVDEVEAIVAAVLTEGHSPTDVDEQDVVDQLLDEALLVEEHVLGRRLYRSRMAETIRLLARLRQLFPSHAEQQRWRGAPRLVADFRLAVRPREFPARSVTVDDALSEIRARVASNPKRMALLEALLAAQGGDEYRLARFQIDATSRVISALDGRKARGVIVTAGTGSGKTLAFYLPALAHIGAALDDERWTKAVAIYPRKELLADQFTETFAQARRFAPVLSDKGLRNLVIGTFYGSTPHSAAWLSKEWTQSGGGRTCPFLRCPECGDRMIWRDDDRRREIERLECQSTTCSVTAESDQIALTRKTIGARPPDILFTTTEMLNRNLSNGWTAHIFGAGPRARRTPLVVLLDEVHTYEGVHGAQVAMLLRRWRHACARPMQFVGLSATLREANRFFATLVGLTDLDVDVVAPDQGDLIPAGREYVLALRGDPVSGASLLSTTIQTAMLTRRVLDPWERNGAGLYGQTVFVFTDDLDVTNRLYNNLQDAEALDSWGRPQADRPDGSLATLRASGRPDLLERKRDGQAWTACEQIGHPLTPGAFVRLERTSSQDAGVRSGNDIVVATASLEVGFNDPAVGAVIQHKAPHDAARFLQRKGRAGRRRSMRPWTIVVLSDYGRDRLAYQGYDLLFDPFLSVRTLPVRNRHVLRMQAVFATMDWLGLEVQEPRGSVYDDLSGPPRPGKGAQERAKRQQQVADALQAVLVDPTRRASLAGHLGSALQLSPEEVEALCWEPPRALMTEAIPTALRRLQTGWRRLPSGRELDGVHQPLPEFVPASLFGDLSLPEVTVLLEDAEEGAEPPRLPIRQALREYAPGRVSRRYGTRHQFQRHWVAPVDLEGAEQVLPIQEFVSEYRELGFFRPDASKPPVRCVRPFALQLARVPRQVRESSTAFPEWETEIVATTDGLSVEAPSLAAWSRLAPQIEFFLHGRREEVQVRRMTSGAEARIVFERGGELETRIEFSDQVTGEPVSLGFVLDVDAIRVRLTPPDDVLSGLSDRAMRSLRSAFFRHTVRTSPLLRPYANEFQRGWLADVYLSCIADVAVASGRSVEEAAHEVATGDVAVRLNRVLAGIFQTLTGSEEQEEGEDRGEHQDRQRLHKHLEELFASDAVTSVLADLAATLWSPPDDAMRSWALMRWVVTLGAAMIEAFQRLCPDLDASDVLLDPVKVSSDSVQFFITETTIGGGGFVEEAHRRCAEDPRRFFRLVESALGPTDFELVDVELRRALTHIRTDPSIASLANRIRSPERQASLAKDFDALLVALGERGAFLCHPVVAALSSRLLRPGSNVRTDDLLTDVIDRWDQEELRLGIELDARVVAYALSDDDRVEVAVGDTPSGGADERRVWRMNVLAGLLWPRGGALREQRLSTYTPYRSLPPSDRLLVEAHLGTGPPVIDVATANWKEQVAAELVAGGAVGIRADLAHRRILTAFLAEVVAAPVEYGHLFLYPRVAGTRRVADGFLTLLELREAVQ